MNKSYAPLGGLHCGSPKPQEIPCRQYCAICGNLYAVDYHISNQEIWDEAIHPHYRGSTVCLECFIRRADEKMLPWDHWITFYPRSSRSLEIAKMASANEIGKMPCSEPQP